MARDVQSFSVTIPPGGTPTAPAFFPMHMPARIVTRVTILVPPGPRGEVGFALAAAGVQYLPSNAGGYITADNYTVDWALEDVIESGAWQIVAYNTGLYSHTLQVVFLCELPSVPPQAPDGLTTTSDVSSSLIGMSVG